MSLNPPDGDVFEDLLRYNFISTLTVMLRREATKNMDYTGANFILQDYSQWLHIAKSWKVKYIRDTTSMYRIANTSVSHNKDIRTILLMHNNNHKASYYFSRSSIVSDEVREYVQDRLLIGKLYLSCYYKSYKLTPNELKQVMPKSKRQFFIYLNTRFHLSWLARFVFIAENKIRMLLF